MRVIGTTLTRCGIALAFVVAGGCNPSRERPDSTPQSEPAGDGGGSTAAPAPSSIVSTAPTVETPVASATSTQVEFPFTDYFDVDQLGGEPVRGSGCGVDQFIGNDLPDGLWRGFVRSFNGLWIDGSTSLEFDLACVYFGDAAVVARQRWVAEHPGEQPTELQDGFMVNNNDRVRVVPIASEFIQVDAAPSASGGCAPPDVALPSGSTEVYRLLDSWLLVEDGEAQLVLTSCPPP